MADFTIQTLVDRARTYIDDDQGDDEGFIPEARWISIFNAEYAQHYQDWVRMGLISPTPVDTAFTGYTTTVSALAIVGVAEDLTGGAYRQLAPAQASYGRAPLWGYTEGPSSWWEAHGTADSMVVTLEPRDTSGNYVVRTIPLPTVADALDDSYSIPFGCDERIVLGMARRAKLKDGAASALLERLIFEADTRINMRAFSRADGDGPKVRRVPRGTAPRVRTWPADPRMWRYSL